MTKPVIQLIAAICCEIVNRLFVTEEFFQSYVIKLKDLTVAVDVSDWRRHTGEFWRSLTLSWSIGCVTVQIQVQFVIGHRWGH